MVSVGRQKEETQIEAKYLNLCALLTLRAGQ